MEDDTITTEETHEEKCSVPEAQVEDETPASEDSSFAEKERIAHLVRTEVEKCLAQMFPAAREAPRKGVEESSLDSREFLRLGYGAQTPQN